VLTKVRRILVPVDGSPTSSKALEAALGIAKESGAHVRLLHVVEATSFAAGVDSTGGYLVAIAEAGKAILEHGLAAAQAAGVAAESELMDLCTMRIGEAVAQAASAWKADLVVVGTHGRHGVGRVLLGSGAEQIIRLAPVPVLVIRGSDADH
jgi:nucleotide-binding universal stress UspA family protein